MAQTEELSVMILVKASPVLTSRLEETMCVAAITLDDQPQWVRLHPVPFRDLDEGSKFRKYEEVTVKVIKPSSDRRPESRTPIEGGITIGRHISTGDRWAERRRRVDALPETTMCELILQNQEGSGPGTPSLAVIRCVGRPSFSISKRDDRQLRDWQRRADAIAAQPSLFDDPNDLKQPFEVVEWRFRYHYVCTSPGCSGHEQTIVDWEAVALWRKVQHRSNWRELMEQKFVDELWADDRDTRLFVGNMEQYPRSFLVLGVFWPPKETGQQTLL